MELTRDDNVTTAADPQAIRATPPRKLPLSDNDPTRNIAPRESVQRAGLLGLVALALLVMAVMTVWVMLTR